VGAIFDPFKARKNRAMEFVIQVPVATPAQGKEGDEDYTPEVKPVFELTVKRLPRRLIENAVYDAEARTRRRGLDESKPGYLQRLNREYFVRIAEELKGHVTGWRNLDDSEAPKFTPNAFAAWLEELDFEWRMLIGIAYNRAHDADEKKTTDQTTTDEALSKPSESDSSTN
jgi:hypothetical protein